MKVYAAVAALLCAAAILFAPFAARTTEYAAAQQGNAVQDVMNAAYARANSRTAYFCTDADLSTGIFAVPYTYCVEILGEEGEWYRVKYAEDYGIYRALYGYVQKNDFTVLEEAPSTVYLYKSVSVTFSQDAPAGSLPVIDDITLTAAFYGSYYSGAAGYSYVLCDDSFGYIVGANEDYPLIETENDTVENEEPEPKASGGTVVAAVAIGALVLVAAALAAFSGKKTKHRKTGEDIYK